MQRIQNDKEINVTTARTSMSYTAPPPQAAPGATLVHPLVLS